MLLWILCFLLFVVPTAWGLDIAWTHMKGTADSDVATAILVNSSTGVVYVAGYASGSLDGQSYVASLDIFLTIYARDGTLVRTVMTGTSTNDVTRGLALNSITGDIYITGYTQASLNGQSYVASEDVFLLKYASNGVRAWTITEGTTGSDASFGVSVDSSTGNVYVAGYVAGSLYGEAYTGSNDMFLAKYDSDGLRLWFKIVGTTGQDFAYGVSVEASTGDIYVIGSAGGALHGESFVGGSSDIILMKYASDGSRLWTKMVGTSGGDAGKGVAVDPTTGYVYVVGDASGSLHGETYSGSVDIFLMKYASNGTRIWTRMAGTVGYDSGYAVSVDSSTGNVFVTGTAEGSLYGETFAGGPGDIFVIKYSSSGTRLDTNMLGSSGNDIGHGVAVDSSTGAVWVAGQAQGSINGQAYVGGADIVITGVNSSVIVVPDPTGQPSNEPTGQPTGQPTAQPNNKPTGQPTGQPTAQPNNKPTGQPTGQPTTKPDGNPTGQPTGQPTTKPDGNPTGQPTGQPTTKPDSNPTGQPTRQPTKQPTGQPSGRPTSDADGRTICQYRTFIDTTTQFEFSRHRCMQTRV